MKLPREVSEVLESRRLGEQILSNRVVPAARERFFRSLTVALRRGTVRWDDPRLSTTLKNRFVEHRASYVANCALPATALEQIPDIRKEVLFEVAKLAMGNRCPVQPLCDAGLDNQLKRSLVDALASGELSWRTVNRTAALSMRDDILTRLKAAVIAGEVALDGLKPNTALALRGSLLTMLERGEVQWRELRNLGEKAQAALLKEIAKRSIHTGVVPVANWTADNGLASSLPYAVAQNLSMHVRGRAWQREDVRLEPELEREVVLLLAQQTAMGDLPSATYKMMFRRHRSLLDDVLAAATRQMLNLERDWFGSAQNVNVGIRRAILSNLTDTFHPRRRTLLSQALSLEKGDLALGAAKELFDPTDETLRQQLQKRLLTTSDTGAAQEFVSLLSAFQGGTKQLFEVASSARSETIRAAAIDKLVDLRAEGAQELLWMRIETEKSKLPQLALLRGFGELGGIAEARLLLEKAQTRQRDAAKLVTRQALRKIAGHSPHYVAQAAEAALVGGIKKQPRRVQRPLRRLLPVLTAAVDLAKAIIDPILHYDEQAGLTGCDISLREITERLEAFSPTTHVGTFTAREEHELSPMSARDLIAALSGGSGLYVDGLTDLTLDAPIRSNLLGGIGLNRLIKQLGAQVVRFLVLVWGLYQLRLIPPDDFIPDGPHLVHAV